MTDQQNSHSEKNKKLSISFLCEEDSPEQQPIPIPARSDSPSTLTLPPLPPTTANQPQAPPSQPQTSLFGPFHGVQQPARSQQIQPQPPQLPNYPSPNDPRWAPSWTIPSSSSRAFGETNPILPQQFASAPQPSGDSYRANDTYLCEECGFVCQGYLSWQEHMMGHSVTRAFECQKCPSRFADRGQLMKHLKANHEKHKPFICEICGSSFGRKSDLRKHDRLVHQKLRPFSCDQCQAAFGQRGDLKKHMGTHRRKE